MTGQVWEEGDGLTELHAQRDRDSSEILERIWMELSVIYVWEAQKRREQLKRLFEASVIILPQGFLSSVEQKIRRIG